jgi:hypothetical protein
VWLLLAELDRELIAALHPANNPQCCAAADADRLSPVTSPRILTQHVTSKVLVLLRFLPSGPTYEVPAGQGSRVPFPKGLPQAPSTDTVSTSTLFVLLLSRRSSCTLLILVPGVSTRVLYSYVLQQRKSSLPFMGQTACTLTLIPIN